MCSTVIICHAVLSGSSYNEECNITIFRQLFPNGRFLVAATAGTAFLEQNTLHDAVGGAQGTLQEPLAVFSHIGFIKSDIMPTGKVTDGSDQLAVFIVGPL